MDKFLEKNLRLIRLTGLILIVMALTACAAATPTPRPIGPTATERPFPTFGPTRTRTPTRVPHPTQTQPATATLVVIAAPTETAPTETAPLSAAATANTQPGSAKPSSAISQPAAHTGQITREQAADVLRSALVKAGVADPKVYWFTFDEGSREQALMIQFSSPLRWQDGYQEMLRSAKQALGQYYLQIDPPLYTAFVVATDLTGTSDTVQRLRRFAPEKLARGEIGEEDFLNNYFEPVQVTIHCAADGACTGKMATPFPVFNFPFPFPTPTP